MDRTTLDADSRDWSHSKPLDVHSWSEYSEVNSFVDVIYSTFFNTDTGNLRIKKKHLKKVLLDLYVTWIEDPTLNIAVHMKQEAYSNGTAVEQGRYNLLNIKGSTIPVVKRLVDVGLIGFKTGHRPTDGYDRGHLSRIWPSPSLIKMFKDVRFSIFDIGYNNSRLVLILNKTVKNKVNGKTKRRVQPIDYDPDQLPNRVKKMEKVIKDYNALLERTFIDIGDAETSRVLVPATKGRENKAKKVYVEITHHSKFTYRVFNNGSWKQGGRFYGGWWQRIGSELRKKILIDNTRTVEVDFSALHPVLAYGTKGLEYSDNYPYDIPIQEINDLGINDPGVSKKIIKLLMLMAFNASDETSLFQAFRGEFYKTTEWQILKAFDYRFTDNGLKRILGKIKEKHIEIADMFATKAGLDLMYLDSQIVEYVIKKFTERNEPVLQIYDSFIVKHHEEVNLRKCMDEAFKEVTGKSIIGKKQIQHIITIEKVTAFKHLDRDYYLDNIKHAVSVTPKTCRGYLNRLNRHNKHYLNKETYQDRPIFTPDEIVEPKKYRKYKDRF